MSFLLVMSLNGQSLWDIIGHDVIVYGTESNIRSRVKDSVLF